MSFNCLENPERRYIAEKALWRVFNASFALWLFSKRNLNAFDCVLRQTQQYRPIHSSCNDCVRLTLRHFYLWWPIRISFSFLRHTFCVYGLFCWMRAAKILISHWFDTIWNSCCKYTIARLNLSESWLMTERKLDQFFGTFFFKFQMNIT